MANNKTDKGTTHNASAQKETKHPEKQEMRKDGDNSAAAIKDATNKGKGPSGENL